MENSIVIEKYKLLDWKGEVMNKRAAGSARQVKINRGTNRMKQNFICWRNGFVSLMTLIYLSVGFPAVAGTLALTVNPLETDNATPILTGTASSGVLVVNVRIGQENHNANVSGTEWSLAWPTALERGTYDVKATATDGANFAYDNANNELVIK